MTAIMKITVLIVVTLSLSACARSVLPNRGHSFYPPIAADGMERALDHPSHPGVILNGQSITANRHYR